MGAKGLEVVGSVDPKLWLAATPDLVHSARIASEFLFSVLAAHTQSELSQLLTQHFDSEQIWQQIDLQATPTLEKIKKSLRKLEKTPHLQLFRLDHHKEPKRRDSKLGIFALPFLNCQLVFVSSLRCSVPSIAFLYSFLRPATGSNGTE